MFASEWIWPVLVSIGLIVVLAGFEVVSAVIADIWETAYSPVQERQKRAA